MHRYVLATYQAQSYRVLVVLIILNQETLPAFLEKIFRLHPIEQ